MKILCLELCGEEDRAGWCRMQQVKTTFGELYDLMIGSTVECGLCRKWQSSAVGTVDKTGYSCADIAYMSMSVCAFFRVCVYGVILGITRSSGTVVVFYIHLKRPLD